MLHYIDVDRRSFFGVGWGWGLFFVDMLVFEETRPPTELQKALLKNKLQSNALFRPKTFDCRIHIWDVWQKEWDETFSIQQASWHSTRGVPFLMTVRLQNTNSYSSDTFTNPVHLWPRTVSTVSTTFQVHSGTRMGTRAWALKSPLFTGPRSTKNSTLPVSACRAGQSLDCRVCCSPR